ncbi:DMT family transporter [Phocicoccus pinnipedialis]|uniref:EamA-like transporter family protein n=1 Tax=Phocicoccus pinnipedialis TaxID=110845 RepID=A0A6V7R0T4_9BACL|nr:DMT family transporter [Jeotgalicoccus pinnipedialis]MBP1938760.1 drug/metabolite transporter (DMT)-like permease [Jeotgalicoccus pinnipedialis]CAD2070684.1 EamA-like transporter family protein [Jeotgalicoccus pinnipedialis]
MNNITKGIIALIISSLGFSLMSFFVKYSGDLPTIQKAFFRNFVSMLVALAFVLYYKERLFGKKENQGWLILRSSLGLIGIVLSFYTLDKLVLSDADILNKLSPFFTIILASIFLKEYIRRFQLVSIIIAFIGALFVIKPSFESTTFVALIGVIGAIAAAGAYTVLRILGPREKFYTVVFYFSTFSTVALLPFFIYQYETMTISQFTTLILSGIFAAVGQFGLTIAYSYAPAKEISIFVYTTIIFTALLSIVFFKEYPDIYSVIGYIIIFAASFYMYMKNLPPKRSALDSQTNK